MVDCTRLLLALDMKVLYHVVAEVELTCTDSGAAAWTCKDSGPDSSCYL